MRTQYFPNFLTALVASAWLAVSSVTAFGQAPVISSFSQNGQLICTNLEHGSVATVEWASSVLGPWTNNWAALEAMPVGSNRMIQVSVPMFYRVRVTPPLPGMAIIPAGTFEMGDTFNEGDSDELPLHTNQINTFYMDKYEVTKTQWDGVYQWAITNGYVFDNVVSAKANNHPVHSVTWYDAVKWCNARSQKEERIPAYYTDPTQTLVYKNGQVAPYVKWNAGYRLPTEAEWEKAARGGARGHRFPWADADTISHLRANYFATAGYAYDLSSPAGFHPTFDSTQPYTSPVGYFQANGYGLYDMAGNVWEWCWDWYGASYYGLSPGTDPRGPATGTSRVLRGGNWGNWGLFASDCRTASRNPSDPRDGAGPGGYGIGFRCVLPPDQE